eukprot:2863371-Rhodomonas_salina.1
MQRVCRQVPSQIQRNPPNPVLGFQAVWLRVFKLRVGGVRAGREGAAARAWDLLLEHARQPPRRVRLVSGVGVLLFGSASSSRSSPSSRCLSLLSDDDDD